MKWKRIGHLLLVAGLAAFESGCATKALWEGKDFREPSPTPNLKLFLAKERQDVLVEYDELRRNGTARRRAYFVSANEGRIEARRRPHFVDEGASRGLEPVACVPFSLLATINPTNELYAAAETNSSGFWLYSHGREVSVHSLPVYPDPLVVTGQVLLTPPAVIVDAVGAATIVGLVVWSQGVRYSP